MSRFRSHLLFVILAVLAWGFWQSEDFLRLSAGVALFMFGMLSLENGFQTFSGGVLEKVLDAGTRTRARSIGFGFIATTLMQSSSLVSLISITFLSAGLIQLAQGIGIVFGANIGTTTGAWLMASYGVKINLASYALPMLVFGILLIYQKDRRFKGMGNVLLGIAFLFIGIQFIKEGFEAVSQGMDLTRFALGGLAGVLAFAAIGIVATVVMQSSHAVLMLTIAALATEQITYMNALALAIGANVGTTITALLGAIGANVAGKRLAGAHMAFNFTTGLVAIVFLQPLASFVDVAAGWMGIAADDYTLKLAIFHTVFNVLGVVLMLPLVNRLVEVLERLLPDQAVVAGVEQPLFLTDALVDYPDAALLALSRETRHMAANSLEIIAVAVGFELRDLLADTPVERLAEQRRDLDKVRVKDLYEHRVKAVYSAIITFASKAQPHMNEGQAEALYQLKLASRRIVEALKLLRLLRRNLKRFVSSDNRHMREQYTVLRIHLGQLVRVVAGLGSVDDVAEVRSRLAVLESAMQADDVVANGVLDNLIRNDEIAPDMASSLMNDSAYASELQKEIIRAAEAVYTVARETIKDRPYDADIEQHPNRPPAA
ncbi:MAG: Na/Pi symporter [Gammaproteobacteria bacterium]